MSTFVRARLLFGLWLAATPFLVAAQPAEQNPQPSPPSAAVGEFDDGTFTAFSF